MKGGRWILLGLLVMAGSAIAGEVYRWTDAAGRTHFGDRPPAGAAGEALRVDAADRRTDAAADAVAAFQGNVVLYSTEWCGVCKRAKAHLRQRGVTFTEHDIEKHSLARAEFQRLGGRGVPLITVGDRRMKGFSAARLDRMLREAGWVLAD